MTDHIQSFGTELPSSHGARVSRILDRLERVAAGQAIAWNLTDAVVGLLRCHSEPDELNAVEFDLLLVGLEQAFTPTSETIAHLRPTYLALLEGFAACQVLAWYWSQPVDLRPQVDQTIIRNARMCGATFAGWLVEIITGERVGAPA